jgi:DNA-binding MarR family transcriptional regulator
MLLVVKQNFVSIPSQIFKDVISKQLIPVDMQVYMFLASKGAHGKVMYINRHQIRKELGGVSLSRVSDSLRRLSKCGHIKRTKLNGITSTRLLSFVKDKNNIFIKGVKHL